MCVLGVVFFHSIFDFLTTRFCRNFSKAMILLPCAHLIRNFF